MKEVFQIDLVVDEVTYSNFLVKQIGENLFCLEETAQLSIKINYKDIIEAKFEDDKLIFQKINKSPI